MSDDTDYRPNIEGLVDRWAASIKKEHGRVDRGAPCSVPFAFLENVKRYIQKLEAKIEEKDV